MEKLQIFINWVMREINPEQQSQLAAATLVKSYVALQS